MQGIISARQRRLTRQKFQEGAVMSFDLPAGEVVKGFIIKLIGYVTPTFTGTVIENSLGACEALMRSVSVLTDGEVLHKKITPTWMRDQIRLHSGGGAPAFYQANSTSLSNPTKGLYQIGATGESVAISEAFEIAMENKVCNKPASSFLNLKGKTSSVLEIDTRELKDLQAGGTSADFAVAGELYVEVSLITAPHMRNQNFVTFRQSEKAPEFSGEANSQPIELKRGANIMGFWLQVNNGDAARNLLTPDLADQVKFQLVKNGTEVLRSFSLHDLQLENISKFPIDELLGGRAYCNLLNNSEMLTALNTGAGSGVEALDLLVTLPSSLTYTNPVRVTIRQDEWLQLEKINKASS